METGFFKIIVMQTLVCFLEEASTKAMLEIVLPKILFNIKFETISFQGKQDLEKQIEFKLKHYNKPDAKFLIMRDKDSGDCVEIKQELLKKVSNSGKAAESIIRIACHELESFYLGDLEAVKQGLNISNLPSQNNKKYRNPDNLANAKQELQRITNQEYQAISGSKSISPYLKLDNSNQSTSFKILLSGIKKLCNI